MFHKIGFNTNTLNRSEICFYWGTLAQIIELINHGANTKDSKGASF